MIIDESHLIKTPGAKRTRTLIRLGHAAAFRRILTGTPGNPLDLYAQFEFLNSRILNFSTYTAFKNYFAYMVELPGKEDKRGNPIKVVAVDKFGRKKYKNVDRLRKLIQPYSFRATKDECLDLPPKVYLQLPVELSKKQWCLYTALVTELVIEFKGRCITATMAIQRMLRLRQIIGGYLPDENGDGAAIDKTNPRIEAMLNAFENFEDTYQVIVWACFKAEIEGIISALKVRFPADTCVRYTGEESSNEKERAKSAFQKGDARFFVSNPACGGVGLDLQNSFYSAFFTNSYSSIQRKQAEDRIHRIGQKHNCMYLDLYAEGTIDEHVINALRQKFEIEAELTGDKAIEWLTENTRKGM
jgi:SNF2 family DNA or RNA helicase